MTLKTDRLLIREVSINDTEHIHQLHSLPETDEFNTLGIPDTINMTEKIVLEWSAGNDTIPRVSYVFCINLYKTKQFIGLIALNLGKPNFRIAEVWYKTHVAHWRKGYTTEALKKNLNFGFTELKLHRIEAGCSVENIASIKLLEKVGFKKEGNKRKNLPIRGEWKDNYFYGILEEDFLKLY